MLLTKDRALEEISSKIVMKGFNLKQMAARQKWTSNLRSPSIFYIKELSGATVRGSSSLMLIGCMSIVFIQMSRHVII
jgi:hypothetical protein